MKLKTTLLTLLIMVLLFLIFFLFQYFSWRQTFFNDTTNTSCYSQNSGAEQANTEEIVKNFVLSERKIEFMTFTRSEIIYLMKNSFDRIGDIEIEDLCLVSDKGVWKIYLYPKIGSLQLPWVGIDIIKDERETVELYSKNLYLGEMRVPEIIAKEMLNKINRGISDGILLVTENEFLGKSIKNVELLKDSIVIN